MSNGELSIGLKLEAKNPTEQRVLDYLRVNASEMLSEKINAGEKTIKGAMSYCKDEARKLESEGGCVVVDDETVFGWVIHFFEEDDIEEPKKPEPRAAGKAVVVHKANPKVEAGAKKPVFQSLFSEFAEPDPF